MSMARSTEISGFLDGREYTASFLYEFCALLVGNGVYANELAPTATNDNMTVTYGSGHAWINGVLYKNITPFNMDFETADGVLNRYDSIMLRLDLSQNEVYAVVEKGAFATSPTPPEVIRNAETYDLKICDVYIPAGCTKITQAQIYDRRLDSAVCGVPVFLIEHLDMTTFYRQIAADLASFRQQEEADFITWVEVNKNDILNLLAQLNNLVDADTVGKLLNQINEKLSTTGGTMTGPIDMDGHSLKGLNKPTANDQAATKEYVDSTVRQAAPQNLLDNSDFRNPVNQRGITSSTANAEYVIDRWFIGDIWTVGACGFSQYDGSIAFTQGLFQRMTVSKDQIAGKTYTLVLKKSDETLLVFHITLPTEIVSGKDHPCVCNNVTGVLRYWDGIGLEVRFETAEAISCVWAALYEGEYREETIPEYRTKGYGAELLECQRYYQIRSTNGISAADMRPTMRLSSPTVTAVSGGYAYCADL